MAIPTPSSILHGLRDVVAFFKNNRERHIGFMVISLAIPLTALAMLLYDSKLPPESEEDHIVYGDIIPANPNDPLYKEWQARKLKDFNERRDAAVIANEQRRQSFQRLADQYGIDTK